MKLIMEKFELHVSDEVLGGCGKVAYPCAQQSEELDYGFKSQISQAKSLSEEMFMNNCDANVTDSFKGDIDPKVHGDWSRSNNYGSLKFSLFR